MLRFATLLVLLVTLTQAALSPVALAGDDIQWRTHAEALPEAARADKPVIIHFTAEWCSWCTKMKKETYTAPEVSELMREKFVTAMVDSDHNQLLNWFYGVQSLPTIWILDSHGRGITRINGYKDAKSFATYLQWVATGAHQETSFAAFSQNGS